MKVLIGCEESQAICKAFRELGVEAYSNDMQDCSGDLPKYHLRMDVFDAIRYAEWNLIILHPPCTALAVSGNSTYAKGKLKYKERLQAVKWTQKLWDTATGLCGRVALENPVGVLNTLGNFPKPNYIQPYEHGHKISKKTGLWLHGLNPITPTNIVEPEWIYYNGNSGNRCSLDHYKNAFSKDRGKLRSKTYSGIAKAIASQWS